MRLSTSNECICCSVGTALVSEASHSMPRLAQLLLGAADAQKSRRPRGGKRKHKNRCRVTGCGTCTADKDVCETCRVGFAKTEEGKCDRCGEGCRSCSTVAASREATSYPSHRE